MSALEQIRKRPAITIGIVGFALILFLFTGINGCDRIMHRNYDTAATVNGKKIKINELNAATEQMREQQAQQARMYGRPEPATDNALLAQQALQQLIDEALLDQAIDKVGIKVTNDEIAALIYGPDALPYFVQQANAYGFNSMEELYDYAKSGDAGSEQAQAIIDNMTNDVRQGLRQQKFSTLLGALTVNKLDAQAYYDASASTANVTIARQDLNSIPDDAVVVSDDEIRAAYNAEKGRYAIPGKQIAASYILVNITPSDDDYTAAQKEVEDAVEGLKSLPGTEAVGDNYNFSTETIRGTRESIADNQIKNNLDSIVNNQVRVLSSGNNFVIGKLLDTFTASEKANVDLIAVAPGVNVDSIVNLLNDGAEVASLDSTIAQQQATGEEVSLIDGTLGQLADTVANAALNRYFVLNSGDNGAAIARVVSRTEPATIYEFAKISRPVEASNKTYNDAVEAMTGYLAENKTAEAFKENASAAGYNLQNVAISPSQLTLLNLPSSTEAARWAVENKKGAVSPIFSDDNNSYIIALVVDDVYSDYLPVSDPTVANPIRQRLINEKKADKLVAELQGRGNSVESYAQAMGTTPEDITVNYGSDYVRGFVPGDAALLANVAAAEQGKLVGPLATQNSVVVFVVNSTDKSPREYSFDTDAATARQHDIVPLQRRMSQIIRGNKKVDYNVQRFYHNDSQQ